MPLHNQNHSNSDNNDNHLWSESIRGPYLVEDGLFRADEAPLEHLGRVVGQHDRVADVEDLAVVVDVGVVAVDAVVALERVDDVGPDGRRVAR